MEQIKTNKNPYKLEICFGPNEENIEIPLIQVSQHSFIINSKKNHIKLAVTLQSWCQYFLKLQEDQYKEYISLRLAIQSSLLEENQTFNVSQSEPQSIPDEPIHSLLTQKITQKYLFTSD